jgi:(p)ppGpp synthase/HD superfamily hydrolase
MCSERARHRVRNLEYVMGEQYAQTNVQLYRQLQQSGYGHEDLIRVHCAYDLAVTLFTASFRGSGKPLLAHLVGTASILASLKESTPVVTAGLLHAAYALGDFGTGRAGITTAKRERVRDVVGPDVELLVTRYTRFAWNRHTIPQILSGVTTLQPEQRDVLVIRLANELEDHLDLGVLYCQNAESRREYIRSPLNQSVEMARRLGLPQLADALDAAFTEVLSGQVPAALRNARGFTFQQPPASQMRRPIVTLRQFFDHHPAFGPLLFPLRARRGPMSSIGQRVGEVP